MDNMNFDLNKFVETLAVFLSKGFHFKDLNLIEESVTIILSDHGVDKVDGFSGGWLSTDGSPYMSIFCDDREVLFIGMGLRQRDTDTILLSYNMRYDDTKDFCNDVLAVFTCRRSCIQDLHGGDGDDEEFSISEIAEMLRSDPTVISLIAAICDLCEMHNIDQDHVDSFKFGRSPINGIPYIIMNTADHDTIFVSESRIVDDVPVKGRVEFHASSNEDDPLSCWARHLEDGNIDAFIKFVS